MPWQATLARVDWALIARSLSARLRLPPLTAAAAPLDHLRCLPPLDRPPALAPLGHRRCLPPLTTRLRLPLDRHHCLMPCRRRHCLMPLIAPLRLPFDRHRCLPP